MTVAYATSGQLAAWTGRPAPADAERLLARASELVDAAVRAAFDVDGVTGLPSDADVAAVLADATCAVVEAWAEVGEANDVDGLAGTQVTVGAFTGRRAPVVPPRAARLLAAAGLLRAPERVVAW